MKLLLYKGLSKPSKLIKWATHGTYSHAALMLRGGRVVEAWADPPRNLKEFITNLPWSLFGATKGGIRVLDNYHQGHTKGTEIDVFQIFMTDIEYEKAVQRLNKMIDHGYTFDFFGMISFILPRVKQKEDRVYCAELVSEVLGLGLERVTPHELGLIYRSFYEKTIKV